MIGYDDQHTIIVQGSGEFPFDMLRHDMAWPADTRSAMTMGMCGRRRVAVTAAKMRHITPERWKSFGWVVVAGWDEMLGASPIPIEQYVVGQVSKKAA